MKVFLVLVPMRPLLEQQPLKPQNLQFHHVITTDKSGVFLKIVGQLRAKLSSEVELSFMLLTPELRLPGMLFHKPPKRPYNAKGICKITVFDSAIMNATHRFVFICLILVKL